MRWRERSSPHSARYGARLVELDPVTRGVGDKRLDTCPGGHWVGHLQALLSQLCDNGREVGERKGEMLALVPWRLRLDEVDLLAPSVEPGPTKRESRPVRTDFEPERANIERQRGVHVVHVDRYVMKANWLHGLDYGTAAAGRPKKRRPTAEVTV
jgi:hypothetical protein